MSEPTEKPSAGTPVPADEIKNLKAEFNRKLDNVSTTLKSSQDALMAQLQKMTAPQKPQPSATQNDDLENLFYKDPVKFAARIKEETRAEIRKEMDAEGAVRTKQQTTLASLYKEFPELQNDDAELTKLAITKHSKMVEEFGDTSPAAYKAAVAEAALELGLKPKSKRPQEDDDFQVSGGGRDRRPARKDDKLDPRVAETARLLGVDPEKVHKRIQNRKNYGNWE